MLIMITGLPGSGKTTFAKALASSLNAVPLNVDIIRDNMGRRGKYNKTSKSMIYANMLRQTESYLHRGEDIVVDATFYKSALRKPYKKLAKKYKNQLFWIMVTAKDRDIKERMQQNEQYSVADYADYLTIKSIYEPLEEGHLILHSDSLSIEKMLVKAREFLSLAPFQLSNG